MQHKKTTLENGLRIITVPMKETQTATVMFAVGVGSRFETEKESGLSHFVEHMLFKGTKKRPTTLHISGELESIGGEFNAFTSKDRTIYYAKSDAKHIAISLDVIADMYLNSKMEEKEIKREKGAIIQEINMYEDIPLRNIEDVFEGMLYPNNSLGWDIAGSKKTVHSFNRQNFVNYLKRFYVPNCTVVTVAGNFNEKKIIGDIKRYFSKMKPAAKIQIDPVQENQKQPKLKVKFKKTDQTHLILGVRTFKRGHEDRYALLLLSVILGGGMSSRLFTEVRERRGLAYYIRTGGEAYADVGYLSASAGVEHKNLEKTVKIILSEFKKISQKKVGNKELQKAKDFVKGSMIMGMESSDEVANFFANQEILGEKIITLEEKIALIDKVSASDILRVAKNIFSNDRLNLAVIGPHKNIDKLEKELKF